MDSSKSNPLCPPIAHVRQDSSGSWLLHPLADHLEGTAYLAESFAKCFGNGDWARLTGLWHDLGKFNPAWQAYLKQGSGYDPEARQEGTLAWHPLILHILDVATVADTIPDQGPWMPRTRMAAILGRGRCPGSSLSHHHSWVDFPQSSRASK